VRNPWLEVAPTSAMDAAARPVTAPRAAPAAANPWTPVAAVEAPQAAVAAAAAEPPTPVAAAAGAGAPAAPEAAVGVTMPVACLAGLPDQSPWEAVMEDEALEEPPAHGGAGEEDGALASEERRARSPSLQVGVGRGGGSVGRRGGARRG